MIVNGAGPACLALTLVAATGPAVAAEPLGRATRPAVRADAGNGLCVAVGRQVVAWSRREAAGRDRPHVVAIRQHRTVANRLRLSPDNGVLLSCVGRAKLSNGLQAPVAFGMKAVNSNWYLFLNRVAPS